MRSNPLGKRDPVVRIQDFNYPQNQAGPDFDPVLHAGSARASGRIGNTAWALWERGEGLVLAFQVLGQERILVPIDSDSEKVGYMKLVAALLGGVRRTTV